MPAIPRPVEQVSLRGNPALSRLTRLRPYTYLIALTIYLPLLLYLDSLTQSEGQQRLLGLATFAFLLVATRFSSPHERRVVWMTVLLWTGVELFASGLWGIYRYRMDNLPLFVPPGHAAIYLLGLRALRAPFMQRHRDIIGRVTLMGATVWAMAGLTVLPLWTGRIDIAGALLLPILAIAVLRSSAAPFYIAIFITASAVEIIGTSLGNWAWAPVQPVTHFPSGNPPSVVAAAYCLFEFAITRITRVAEQFREQRRLGSASQQQTW